MRIITTITKELIEQEEVGIGGTKIFYFYCITIEQNVSPYGKREFTTPLRYSIIEATMDSNNRDCWVES